MRMQNHILEIVIRMQNKLMVLCKIGKLFIFSLYFLNNWLKGMLGKGFQDR